MLASLIFNLVEEQTQLPKSVNRKKQKKAVLLCHAVLKTFKKSEITFGVPSI